MSEKKKPGLTNIILTAGVSAGLLRNTIEVGLDVYKKIQDNAPQLQRMLGEIGYQILEKGAPVTMGLIIAPLAYIGGKATYKYLSTKKPGEFPF